LRGFPQVRWAEAFFDLQKVYGDLMYFNVLGQPIIVVNSLEDARELMEKRGNIHSGRPKDVMNYTVCVHGRKMRAKTDLIGRGLGWVGIGMSFLRSQGHSIPHVSPYSRGRLGRKKWKHTAT
jgi:hypothetical protein